MSAPTEPRIDRFLDHESNVAALKGEKLPFQGLDNKVSRPCIIHGIRTHDGFGEELRGLADLDHVYTRALNARAIMSNRVPEMSCEAEIPYCFWDPDVPSESTLRSLVYRHPNMKYHIGRVCAMTGNTALYRELDLLPDVAIAEEARDNKTSGQPIYDAIMEQPVRYAVMDDYNLEIRSSPVADACLNGDTCVRSTLRRKHRPQMFTNCPDIRRLAFDITEDRNIALDSTYPEDWPVDPEAVRLLYHPLPRDLPTVDKDLLILMAAWSGDIDRYVRLRRPHQIPGEDACVVRGIYHSTLFAKWCSLQPDLIRFRSFVHARFIMDNNLGWASGVIPSAELPFIIWHPQPAFVATYRELARRQPALKPQIAEACIVADYHDLYDELDPTPIPRLLRAAQKRAEVGVTHYLDGLTPKLGQMGIGRDEYWTDQGDDTEMVPGIMTVLLKDMEFAGCAFVPKMLTVGHVGYQRYLDPWGMPGDAHQILTHVSTIGLIEIPEPYDSIELQEVYEDWPYVIEEDRCMLGLAPNPRRPRGGYRRYGEVRRSSGSRGA